MSEPCTHDAVFSKKHHKKHFRHLLSEASTKSAVSFCNVHTLGVPSWNLGWPVDREGFHRQAINLGVTVEGARRYWAACGECASTILQTCDRQILECIFCMVYPMRKTRSTKRGKGVACERLLLRGKKSREYTHNSQYYNTHTFWSDGIAI